MSNPLSQSAPQDRPARRAGPRLALAARLPRHAHPQPDPDRRENGVRPAGQPYPDATPSLRAARGTYPTDPEVAIPPTREPANPEVKAAFGCSRSRNFGLD